MYLKSAVNAFAFDLQAACSGFLFGMSAAAAYIESENTKNTFNWS
jgi:3-oxoacyl-[acyl-carrier-protein] synthase-3